MNFYTVEALCATLKPTKMSLHFHNFLWIPSVHIHYTASAFKGQLQGVVGCVLAVKNNTSQIIYTFADLKYNLYLGCIFILPT